MSKRLLYKMPLSITNDADHIYDEIDFEDGIYEEISPMVR